MARRVAAELWLRMMHEPPTPTVVVDKIAIHPLLIPLRGKVSHATSQRGVADPVIVGVELHDGTLGYGETLPRAYVTGETVDSVVEAIRGALCDTVVGFHPASFSEALEFIESLPWKDASGKPIPAARAAVELALLDASMRYYGRDMDDVVRWMGLPGFGSPGSVKRVRFSGVLAADGLERTRRQLRKMYWGGLRQFKLKVGTAGDIERLEHVARYLSKPISNGRASLRLDANGVWKKAEAIEWLCGVDRAAIAAVEQPLHRGEEGDLPEVRRASGVAVFHDESLVTRADAERLIELEVADGFNIRISKCGGLMAALRLAGRARREGVRIQLGCMVGETGILSAAGLRFLEVCPEVEWAEGCFGSFLLAGDVVREKVRFGFGGKPPRLRGPGLGFHVLRPAFERYGERSPVVLNL